MSKVLKILASAALVAGAIAFASGPAAAQHSWHGGGGHSGGSWHGGGGGNWHGGGSWHGGGWGYRGWGWGYRGWGWGWPAYYGYGPYYGPYYYAGGPANCGWVPVQVWRNGYLVTRRVWRCW